MVPGKHVDLCALLIGIFAAWLAYEQWVDRRHAKAALCLVIAAILLVHSVR